MSSWVPTRNDRDEDNLQDKWLINRCQQRLYIVSLKNMKVIGMNGSFIVINKNKKKIIVGEQLGIFIQYKLFENYKSYINIWYLVLKNRYIRCRGLNINLKICSILREIGEIISEKMIKLLEERRSEMKQ